MQCDTVQTAHEIDLARQVVYQFLSLAFSDPLSRRWHRLRDPAFLGAAADAAAVLREAVATHACQPAPGELPPERLDLDPAAQFLRDRAFDVEAQYQRTFGLMISKKHPPYESEYCPQTFSVYRAQVIADVAGFYRAFGLEPSREMPERHDHLALQLEFMAWLIAMEQAARRGEKAEQADICRDAQRSFLRDHVVWWTPAFATALRLNCEGPRDAVPATDDAEPRTFYGAVAAALMAFVHVERVRFEIPAPTELIQPRASDLPDERESGYDESCASEGRA